MGLFNYNKEPKNEIQKDTPQKRSFFRFFDIYFRKFWHFGKANLLYSAALIPTFIPFFLLMLLPTAAILGSEADGISLSITAIMFVNLYISLWGMGPSTAGITYVMRNYAREEHSWLWSDFKETFKNNFKQALALLIIDIIVAGICYVAIIVYSNMSGPIGGLKYAIFILLFIYTMMHLYIYPMMITFKLSLIDIYKNAFIFAIIRLPINVLIIFIQVLLHVMIPTWAIVYGGTYYLLLLLLILMLEVVLTQSFSSFMVNFSVYPAIKKYMLDAAEDK